MVSHAAPLGCSCPSGEAGLLPPSMQGEGKKIGAAPEGEEPPTREEEEEEGVRMQANPAYLPIDSYNVPEEERIDMPD